VKVTEFISQAATADEFRVSSYLEKASTQPQNGIAQLLDTIDGAVEDQEKMIDSLEKGYESLSGSVFGRIKDGINSIPSPNLGALRKRLVEIGGDKAGDLVSILFDKALDTAFIYASRVGESMPDRVLNSLQVYSEVFFRSDTVIIDACASYLAKQVVLDMRDIAAEMDGVEAVLVKINSIMRDLALLEDVLTNIWQGE